MKKISRVVLEILMVVLSLSVTPKAAFAENKTVTVIKVGNEKAFDDAINTVNSASEGEYVISLTDDMEINGVSIQSQCPVTLLGNGHTLTVARYASIHVAKGAQVKLGSEDGNVLEIRSVSETSNDVPGLLEIKGTCEMYSDVSLSGRVGNNYFGGGVTVSGGEAQTTNNRMELTAVIEALRLLKEPCEVELYSDSKYVIDALSKGWVYGWQKKGWVKSDKKPALNVDLWERLLPLIAAHDVRYHWVKGHAENEYNNRCDELAVAESRKYK